jgi:uncharacterized protein YbcI
VVALLLGGDQLLQSRLEEQIAVSEAMQQDAKSGMAGEITRGLVGLHTEYYGKGPTKARTYMVNDTVVCLLYGGFTTVEQTLITEGNSEAVHDMRHSFQMAMEERFTQVVQEATERKVVAYLSQIHSSPDIAVELFVLEPAKKPVTSEHEQDPSQGDVAGEAKSG